MFENKNGGFIIILTVNLEYQDLRYYKMWICVKKDGGFTKTCSVKQELIKKKKDLNHLRFCFFSHFAL